MHTTALNTIPTDGRDATPHKHSAIAGRTTACYARLLSLYLCDGRRQMLNNLGAALGFHRRDIHQIIEVVCSDLKVTELRLDDGANVSARETR